MYLIATSNTFQTTLFNGLLSTYLSKVLRYRLYVVLSQCLVTGKLKILHHLTTKGDGHLISPYRITLESNVEVMRIKEMITNFRGYRMVNQFSFSTIENVQRTVWRIQTLMLGCRGIIALWQVSVLSPPAQDFPNFTIDLHLKPYM